MSSTRHERISDLFLEACRLDSAERVAFLERECAGDPELQAAVESLLAHDGSRLLETGAAVRAVVDGCRCITCGEELPPGEDDCPRCRTRTISVDETPRIPGYEIIRLIGEGAMGKVYLAEDTTLRRRVAIKVGGNLALREARMMAQVEHRHIVRVYSFGEIDDAKYIVMEYVEGETLARRIRSRQKLDVEESLRILKETIEALQYAWGKGIVHRDIKPANIMIDTDDRVRVADFGLAKALEPSLGESPSEIGRAMGTPHYMSPEQARGELDVDYRTDIYALGIVLFEMLVGRPPYEGTHALSIVDQHLHTPMPSLRSRRPELSQEIDQLCEWMTCKERRERPGSYDELRQVIDGLLGRALAGDDAAVILPSFFLTEEEEEETAPVFVGRLRELQRLQRSFDSALAGSGRLVLVTGEAGSGKTALISEFARRCRQAHSDLIVARGNCDAQTGIGDPYLPFRDVIGSLTGDVESGFKSGAIEREHASRLWNLLPIAVQAILDHGPDLVGTFLAGQALVARATTFTAGPAGWRGRLEELVRRRSDVPRDVTLQQSHLFEQYVRVLEELARQRPLLLELEDLHWADAGSCSLLFHLARRVAGHRILVVATFRPEQIAAEREGSRHPMENVVNELRRLLGDIEVRLGEEETREFIDALVDVEPNRLAVEFRNSLFRLTRGHPLFAVELLRSMRERGMLVMDAEDCWVEQPVLDWGTLPARVEGAIAGRIERLPDKLQRVLSLASIQGVEFAAEVLAELQSTDRREIVEALSGQLDKRHRLVSAQGIRRIDGRRVSTYRFRHILFQKYLYGRMDEVERPDLHEEVGLCLERLYGDRVEDVALQLAWHFEEACIPDKAIRYLRQAGDTAVRLSANESALAHYRKALALLDELGSGSEATRRELDLQLALGPPLLATAGPGSAQLSEAYLRAKELCERVGDAPQLFQTLFILVHHHANGGQSERALELANQLLEVTESADEPLPVVMAYWARAFASHFLGRLPDARRNHERVLELYEPERDSPLAYVFGMDPAVSSLSLNSLVLWCMGFPEQAAESNRRGLTLARKLDHPSSLAHALVQSTCLAIYRRDLEGLQKATEELLAVSRAKGVVLFEAWGRFTEGWSWVEQGRPREGIERIREGLSAVRAAGCALGIPLVLSKLAQAHASAGDVEEGLAKVDQAIAAAGGDRTWEPESHRIKGEMLVQRNARQAEACFTRAIEIARKHGALAWEMRAAVSLARLCKAQRRESEVRPLLEDVYRKFTEGCGTPALEEAEGLLAEAGSSLALPGRPRPTSG